MHDGLAVCLIVAAIISMGSVAGGLSHEKGQWEETTVARGLAMYCPNSGDWAWIGECE
jgi:hypothetical protein